MRTKEMNFGITINIPALSAYVQYLIDRDKSNTELDALNKRLHDKNDALESAIKKEK